MHQRAIKTVHTAMQSASHHNHLKLFWQVCSKVSVGRSQQISALPRMALVENKTVRACMQATPANWPYNHDSIGKKGWAFLLPTVTPEDAKLHFPDHHSCQVCTHYTCTDRCTCKNFWWSTSMYTAQTKSPVRGPTTYVISPCTDTETDIDCAHQQECTSHWSLSM